MPLWHNNCHLAERKAEPTLRRFRQVLKMNRRLMLILLSAFVVAAACSFLVVRIVGNRLNAPHQSTTQVVAAAGDIKLGSVLRPQDLTTISVVGAVPPGAILKTSDAVGRGVLSDIYKGEPIVNSRLAAVGAGGGLAATIPPGMRACAVKVDDVVGVAGFATPGMRVDVLISGNPGKRTVGDTGTRVKTLMQNIEVLSAGTDIQRDAEGKPKQVQVVNLLVTPEEAELLSLAGNETKIQLVLRNPLDSRFSQTTGADTAQLFGATPVKPTFRKPHASVAVPASRVYLVEVFNGAKRSEAKFTSHEAK